MVYDIIFTEAVVTSSPIYPKQPTKVLFFHSFGDFGAALGFPTVNCPAAMSKLGSPGWTTTSSRAVNMGTPGEPKKMRGGDRIWGLKQQGFVGELNFNHCMGQNFDVVSHHSYEQPGSV